MVFNNNLELLNKAMNASEMRQQAISSNITNINTDGYKTQRVSFEEKLKRAMNTNELELSKTNQNHLSINGELNEIIPETYRKTNTSVKDNGNNVDIETEMSEKAANDLYYSILSRQVSHELSQLNYVINH